MRAIAGWARPGRDDLEHFDEPDPEEAAGLDGRAGAHIAALLGELAGVPATWTFDDLERRDGDRDSDESIDAMPGDEEDEAGDDGPPPFRLDAGPPPARRPGSRRPDRTGPGDAPGWKGGAP